MPKNTASAKAPVAGTDEIIGELAVNTDGSVDSNGKVFSGDNLTALYDAILGNGYTGKGTLKNVEKLLNLKGTAKLGSGVATKALNATDFRTIGGKDIYVTLGGIEWEVVYLTTNRSGDIIVDLWQATSSVTSQFGYGGHTENYKDSYSNISSIYGTCYMRAVTLGNGGTYYTYSSAGQKSAGSAATATSTQMSNSAYAEFATGNFASYLDAPTNIDYQEKEGYPELKGLTGVKYEGPYTMPNEAYGTPTVENYFKGGTHPGTSYANMNSNYSDHAANTVNSAGATVVIPSNHKAGYEDWQYDKVWLPSGTEVLATDGIWGLSTNQCSNKGGSTTGTAANGATQAAYTYLRTGHANSTYDIQCIYATGAKGSSWSTAKLAVRPAIHLNLTNAQADATITKVPEPQNVTVDYDGNSMWLDSLEDIKNTDGSYKFKWIDSTLHNDASIVTVKKIEYTNKDADGTDIEKKTVTKADVLSAGKYEVTLEIPTSSTDYEWNGGGTGEKSFTIIVNQKAVPYTLQINGSGTPNITYGDTYTASLSQTAVTPSSALPTSIYEMWYKGVTPTVYAESKTAPTEVGKYSLTLKPAPDPTNAGKYMPSNYKLSLTGSTFTFDINAKEYTPLTAPASQVYDGSTKSFTVNGYDPTIMTVGTVTGGTFTATLPTGLTETATHTFEATDAGKYTVAFRLPLDSADGLSNRNYKWTGKTEAYITVDIEVEQRTLEVDWDLLTGQTNWTLPVTATGALSWNYKSVADNQPVAGENVKLQYRFYYTTDGDSTASTPADSLDVKDIHDSKGATSRPQGSYTVQLIVGDNTASGGVDGKNYKIGTSGTLIITLGAGKADINSLIKQVATGTALPVDYDGLSDPLEYSVADGTEAVITQKFDIGWASTVDYLTLGSAFGGSAYKYEKWDGTAWVAASDTNGAGKYRVTAALAIVAGKDYTFDTTLIGTTTTKGFKVESVAADELSATVSFEVEIAKKEIDTTGFKLQYSYDQSTWKNFDTEFKTEFVDRTIYVRVNPDTMKPAVAGITAKFGTSDYATGKIKQSYNVTASFTLTDADNFKITDKAFSWEITNKQIKVGSNADWEPVDFTLDGVDYIGELMGIKGHSTYYPNVIEYEYSWYPESNPSNIQTGTGDAAAKAILTTASDTNKIKVTITVKVKPSVTDYELTGGATTCAEFTVGSDKTPITAATAGSAVYGDITGVAGFGVSVTKDDGTVVPESDSLGEIYAVYLYEYDGLSIDTSVTGAGTLLRDVDYAALNAGKYVIEVRLATSARDSYSLKNGKSIFEIERKQVAVPTVKEIIFTGSAIDLADYLEGFDGNIMELDGLHGVISGIKADTYGAVIKLKDEYKNNYMFVDGSAAVVATKLVLTDGGNNLTITDNDTVANFDWTISPYVLDTANLWNLKGNKGASIKLPQQFAELLNDPSQLSINYSYAETKGGAPLENAELKGGKTFYVNATLDGEYANSFVFKDSGTKTSAQVAYTVPQSGAAAFFGNALGFLKSHWLWFVIALAILLFLIILICIIAHRRKTKEAREEKKAQKEEEKRRREEEREAARAKQQAELELQKAKQEAELAKMRAGLGLGAGAAGMAMAQQQPQQQMQMQQYQQPMMQQPQYPQYPQYMPQQMQGYGPQQYGGGDPFARIEAELANLRSEHRAEKEAAHNAAQEITAAKFEAAQAVAAAQMREEFAKLRAGGMQPINGILPLEAGAGAQKNLSSEILGDAIISAVRKLLVQPKEEPQIEYVQKTEESAATAVAPTVYPPDAVITTTTTVDTTKPKQSAAPRSDDGRVFDLDGFYDTFDNNK